VQRPDLLNPASIGTDSSNYYAAGQRLNDGHMLYVLVPGDRPVANGTDPSPWTYPLLSPPPIAAVWRALAILPGDLSMYLWWSAGAGLTLLFGYLLILRLSLPALLVALPLLPSLAITAWSGNLNAFLIPAAAAVWGLRQSGFSRRAGLIIGVASVLKFTPALYGTWFLSRKDWRAITATALAALATLAFAVAGASAHSFFEYLAVAKQASTVGLSPLSPVSLSNVLRLAQPVAVASPYLIALVCCGLGLLLRERPRWSFAVCTVGVALGTPSVRFETLAWLLVALVPWASRRAEGAASTPPGESGIHEFRAA
jgi:hypothetical protein